jgi:hypothetical protein
VRGVRIIYATYLIIVLVGVGYAVALGLTHR